MSTNSLYPGTTNGVCVTSIINDKIREYMMGDSSQQMIKSSETISLSEVDKENTDSVIQENRNGKQDPVSTTDLLLPSSLDVSMHNSTDPCPHRQDIVTASVRRIGNSLDALLQESKRASHTKPVKKSTLANQQNTDRLFISSDQIRSRKSVTLHDICEEYIQFITVNSSVSTDEEAISTTSENETDKSVKIQEPELEIIPVSAVPVRNSQISVITINELASSVIRQSVEEMHVTVENECEKSNGEDGNEEKLITEVEMDSKEELFALNGVKSVVEEEHENSVVPEEKTVVEKEETEIGEKVSVSISNGVNHDVNDDIEEEMEEDEEEVKESVLKEETAVEKLADETSMETDEVLPESDIEQEEKEDKKEAESEEKSAELEGKVEEVAANVEEEKSNEEPNKAELPVVEPVEEKSPEIQKPEEEQKSEENKEEEPKVEVEVKVAVVESTEKNVDVEEKKSPVAEDVNNENKNKVEKKEVPEKETTISKESNAPVSNGVAGVKRRAEASDDVETERDGGISSSSSSSGSETENVQDCKRIRFDESIFEEDERERLIREFVERSTESSEEIGKNCDKLQHEISALTELARAKELEWNSIMRLLKLKEEMLERISFKKRHLDCQNKPELDANLNKLYKNFVTSSTTSVDQIKQPSRSETCTPTSNNNSVTVVPIASSATTSNGGMLNSSSQDFYKTAHSILNADSVGKLRPHRPILPKPPSSSSVQPTQPTHVAHASHTPILPHSSQTPAPNVMQTTPLIVDQNSVIGEGRQGPILDVKSIIADFRSKNPDSLPRRGRRNLPFGSRIPDGGPGPRFLAANTSLLSMANMALGTGSHVRTSVTSTTHNELRPSSFMMGQDSVVPSLSRSDMHMRSNIDSLMLVNAATAAAASGNSSQPNSNSSNSNSSSFQEALVKFAKMNEKRDISSNAGLHIGSNKNQSHLPPPPPYPEVTLHPVVVPQSSGSPPVQNSLLHGILTKSSASGNSQHHPSSTVGTAGVMNATSVSNIQHRPTTFSPTLARLLTAPERNRVNRSTVGSSSRNPKSNLSELLHSKKTRTEVTITPVTTSTAGPTKNGSDVVLDDDDESEATDRLVIDEGREVNTESSSNVIPADQVPECQGCHKKAAQFVCAGCGNQWYCSRECQVQAWEDHSEMCCG